MGPNNRNATGIKNYANTAESLCSTLVTTTRRPASAHRTARAANYRRNLEGRRTLIDGYLESPFPTACCCI